MLDHYLHTAHAANALLYTCRGVQLASAAVGTRPESFTSQDEARSWLLAERRVLVTAVAKAAETGLDTHCWQLAAALAGFLGRDGDWRELVDTQQTALVAAQRLDDHAALACSHRGLGEAWISLAAFQDAESHLQCALTLYRALGDRPGEGGCLFSLGRVATEQGQLDEALRRHESALSIHRDLDDKTEVAWALNAVGWVHAVTGNCQLASSYCQSALEAHRELGDCFGQACTLHSLAYICGKTGRRAEAAEFYQDAVVLFRQVSHRYYEALTMTHLGDTYYADGQAAAARQNWQRAVTILTDLQHPQAAEVHTRLREPSMAASLSLAP